MLKQKITVLVQTTVAGPNGFTLRPGKVVELEDNDYTRLLLKSETVILVDPPSLDLDFLEKGGYELQEGYSYDDLKPSSTVEEEEPKKTGKEEKLLDKSESEDSEEQNSNEPVPEESSPQKEGAMVEEETLRM